MWIRFGPKNGSAALYLEEKFSNYFRVNILDNYKSLLFCFYTFGFRCCQVSLKTSPDPDPGLTEDVWHQKYDTKKKAYNYLEYSWKEFLKFPFLWGTKPWIRFLAKTGSTSLPETLLKTGNLGLRYFYTRLLTGGMFLISPLILSVPEVSAYSKTAP